MKFKLFLLLILSTALYSCQESANIVSNTNIDNALRTTIRTKNDSLISALKGSDMKALVKLGSADFNIEVHKKVDKMLWPFRNDELDSIYTVFDEYRIITDKVTNTALKSDKHDYTFTFTNRDKDTYVSLLEFKSRNGVDTYLATIIYGRFGNEYKITHTNLGLLSVYGKTAADYYTASKQYDKDAYDIDALRSLEAANSMLSPSGTYLVYSNSENIPQETIALQQKLEAKYKFPKVLENVKGNPVVTAVSPVKTKEEISHVIIYTSQIPIKDTITLSQEFEEVKKDVKQIYTGINFNRKQIYYRATNANIPQDAEKQYHEFKVVKQ